MPRARFLQLAFLLAILTLAVYAPVVSATCGLRCVLTDGGTSPTATGIGNDCTTATNSLNSQLQTYTRGYCPSGVTCQSSVTITVACHADGTGYSISGYETFGCQEDTCL
ncbi:MAG TPA: hypothetical protein VGP73_15160 [Thermoanaerobaculia bacterium]